MVVQVRLGRSSARTNSETWTSVGSEAKIPMSTPLLVLRVAGGEQLGLRFEVAEV
ncbi:MAG: hypothetical protein AB1Z98_34700 [Nannocystaceae bacterium]